MFKKFVKRIVESQNREDAIANVFYGKDGVDGEDGIDMAFQHGKISWEDHQTLLALIEKMA